MRLVFFIAIFMIGAANRVFPQEFSVGIGTGIGKYSMSGLKDINSSIMDQLPFDSDLTSDFPPYFYYEPSIMARFGKVTAGIVYSFQSTGSRISAMDYSGEYRLDMKVRSSAPGLFCEYAPMAMNNYRISVYTSFKGVFSRLQVDEILMIADNPLSDDSQKFQSFSFLIEPGLNLTRAFGIAGVGIMAGYAIDAVGKPYHSTDNEDKILINPATGKQVRPDWRGFRAGIKISISLIRKTI